MPTIARLSALEILDSRGRPTLRATCELAGGQVPLQDVLVVPRQATVDACLAATYAVVQAAAALCRERYGMRALVADEGGLAPAFEDAETMLRTAVEAIERAGFRAGEEI